MNADHFQFLEDSEDSRTQQWLSTQQVKTEKYFSEVPQRAQIHQRLTELMNYPKIGVPWLRGDHLYYFSNIGLQNQSAVCRKSMQGDEQVVVLDPQQFSQQGNFAISGLRLSEDCSYLAFGLSQSGSDWQEWRVRDLRTFLDLTDRLGQIRGGIVSWKTDNSGFFYTLTRDETEVDAERPTAHQVVMFHQLGTEQKFDQTIFECPLGKNWTLIAKVSDDGQDLLIFAYESANDQNRIWLKKMNDISGEAIPLIEDCSAYYVLFASNGGKFWFRTNAAAPRGQILEIDASDSQNILQRTIVSEEAGIIERASIVDETLIIIYLQHACSNAKLFELDGKFIAPAKVPQFGSLVGFEGLRHHQSCYFSYSSFNTPQTVYEFDVKANRSQIFFENRLPFNPDDFVTKQVFVDRGEGVVIPMFVSHHRDLDTTKEQPCYLYSYGGFGFCHKPFFSTANLHWMELNGIFCLANVRGGGEYGQEWHDGGRLSNKMNTFTDFVACAQWLVDHKLTSPNQLAIGGRSNGGLTVAASALIQPKLFRAAIVAVGVLDLLRFHKLTVGWTWKAEYGDPEDPDDHERLLKYSPVHNVLPNVSYPSFLVSTADHDDRVHPSHSFKFARVLQDLSRNDRTSLLRVERQVGHGQGKPLTRYIEEITEFLCFLIKELEFK